MPLPTTAPETAESAYLRVLATARAVKSNLTGVASLIAAGGPVSMDTLIGLYQSLNASQGVGRSIQSVDGLTAYAKAQLGPDYDIQAEFGKSIVACKAVTDWLLTGMPGDGQGGFICWRKQDDGTIARITIDLESIEPLTPLIAAALATFA